MDETPREDPEQPITAPKIYFKSVSNLKLYRQCGLSWKKQKFDKVPYQPAAWLPQGTGVHKAYEAWELAGRDMTVEEVTDVYYRTYDEEIEKYKEQQPDLSKWLSVGRTSVQNDIVNRRERGAVQTATFIIRCVSEPWKPWELPDGSPAVEVSFNLDLGFGPVRGYIDLIKQWDNGDLTILDVKSGNREETALQLAVYAHAANETFGLDIYEGSWYYAKDDTYSDRIDLSKLTIEYLAGEFEAQERGIQNRVFNANPGKHCALCPARDECVEYTVMH